VFVLPERIMLDGVYFARQDNQHAGRSLASFGEILSSLEAARLAKMPKSRDLLRCKDWEDLRGAGFKNGGLTRYHSVA